jgi:hypothetical protein
MAEETKAAEATKTAAPEAPAKLKKKKSRPTNCAQSNKRIRRKDWYYRDGKYFSNKQTAKLYAAAEAEKAEKAKEAAQAEAAKAKEAAKAAEAAPAAGAPPAGE